MTISVQTTREDALRARREELLTVKEFADVWRMNKATVWRMVRQGRLPGVVKIGREIRIDLAVACGSQRSNPHV